MNQVAQNIRWMLDGTIKPEERGGSPRDPTVPVPRSYLKLIADELDRLSVLQKPSAGESP